MWQRERRDDASAVAAVNARFLDVLHNRANYSRFAIGDAIHIDFDRVFKKTIDEHRTIGRYFDCACHVAPKISLSIDKLHGSPTKDE